MYILFIYKYRERDATCYNPLALCVHLSIDSLAKVYKRLAAKADHRGLMDDNHLSNCGWSPQVFDKEMSSNGNWWLFINRYRKLSYILKKVTTFMISLMQNTTRE